MRLYLLILSFLAMAAGSCSKDASAPADSLPTDTYFTPLTGTDWETLEPSRLGWDAVKIDTLLNFVESNNSIAFIVLWKGRIVIEKYWDGANLITSAKMFSATKSVGAFLTGLAQEQGKLQLDDPVSKYLGDGWSLAIKTRESKITVRHLISMNSGLTEALTYEAEPGTKWFYNTPAYHKLYDVLAAAYGQTNTEYTKAQLWDKIGMQNSFWDTEPLPSPGPTLSCSARDMARFGLMISAGGKWKDQTIMTSSTYFNEMLHSSQSLNPSYGYLWWLNGQSAFMLPGSGGETYSGSLVPAAPADMVSALGYGDKKIYVARSKDLVVIRHGAPSNYPISFALSNFDNQIWQRLMAAMP